MTGIIHKTDKGWVVRYPEVEYETVPAPKGTMGNYRKNYVTKELLIFHKYLDFQEGIQVKFEKLGDKQKWWANILKIEKSVEISPTSKAKILLRDYLTKRAEIIELLEVYSKFLEEHGYIDSDWWAEAPGAIDEFLKIQENDKKREK